MTEKVKIQKTQQFFSFSFVAERTQLNVARAKLVKKSRLNTLMNQSSQLRLFLENDLLEFQNTWQENTSENK